MEYLKLIVLNIDDFCSSIVDEINYSINCESDLEQQKKDMENQGFACLKVKIHSNLV